MAFNFKLGIKSYIINSELFDFPFLKRSYPCLLCCIPFLVISAKTTSIETLDPYVINGSRLPSTPHDTDLTRQVYNADRIARLNPTGITDFLRELPGLHVDQPGPTASTEAIFLHGGEPNFTLVSLDGIRLNNSTNIRGGSGDFSVVDPWFIENVSLITGSQSSTFGSESLNGVVSMSLRDRDQPSQNLQGRIRAEWGERNYRKLGVDSQGKAGLFNWFGAVSTMDEGDPVPGAGFRATRFIAGVDHNIGKGGKLQFTNFYSDARKEGFPADSGGSRLAVLRELELQDSETFGSAIRANIPWKNNLLEIRINHFNQRDNIQSPGIAPGLRDPFGILPNQFSNHYKRTEIQSYGRFYLNKTMELVLGTSYEWEEGNSHSFLFFPDFTLPGTFRIDRKTWSLFGETNKVITDSISAKTSFRVDQTKNDGSFFSPQFSLLWKPPDSSMKLQLNTGKGYKLPSFFALANPIVGNPDLTRETAETLNLAWELQWLDSIFSTQANLFYYSFNNLVDFVAGPPPIMMNAGKVNIRGTSLETSWNIRPNLTLSGHATWQEISVSDPGINLLNRPTWRSGFSVDAKFRPNLHLSWNLLFVGKRKDSSIPTGGVVLEQYGRSDLGLNWKINDHFFLRATIDNLFNKNYEERIGFPGLKRRLRLSYEYQF